MSRHLSPFPFVVRIFTISRNWNHSADWMNDVAEIMCHVSGRDQLAWLHTNTHFQLENENTRVIKFALQALDKMRAGRISHTGFAAFRQIMWVPSCYRPRYKMNFIGIPSNFDRVRATRPFLTTKWFIPIETLISFAVKEPKMWAVKCMQIASGHDAHRAYSAAGLWCISIVKLARLHMRNCETASQITSHSKLSFEPIKTR